MVPGSYCLKITPTSPTLLNGWHPRPVFYLSVPADKQLVYAGTIIFDRSVEKWGKKNVTTLAMSHFSDESQAAKIALGGKFADLGEMTPQLLVSYDSPAIDRGQLVEVAGKPASTANARPVVKGDNWSGAGTVGGVLAYSGGYTLLAAGNGSGDGAGYVAAAGVALVLLAVPVALTTGGITAEIHREKWARYEPALRKQVTEFHLEEKLQKALAERLHAIGTNSTAMPALRLEAQPYRVVLRGDEHQKFNLEMAARVRLLNPADSSTIWEHDYAYSYMSNDADSAAYQTVISFWAEQHRLEEYRGDSGRQLLAHELDSAVGAISDQVISQLYN
jgi:hypothetical protein